MAELSGTMRWSLCNEVIRELPFPRQCELAAKLGYEGLEIAPFTLSDEPHLLSAGERAAIRRAVADSGIAVSSLHWLLVAPKGLSITAGDAAVRARTIDVMRRLVELCAELGGSVLVHGSPAQRRLPESDAGTARGWALEAFRVAAEAAEAAGVTYCLEPLAKPEANFVNTVAEAAAIVDDIGSPAFRTMVDTSAAGLAEAEPVAAVLARWLPTGLIAHVQVNDRNRRAPGQGEDDFAPILAALLQQRYIGWVAVEPFVYEPDGTTTAARAVGYLDGVLKGLGA
jgi:D-psicose/D-tagatose/L-ribulose 3-epimerase